MLLRVEGLARRHGAVQAVDGVSFAVAAGEVFGLLGPNGAGKTTTVDCILGLARPDAGHVEVAGIDIRREPRAARAKIGAVLQATGLQDKITPRETLRLFSSLSFPSPGLRFAGPEDKLPRESGFGLLEKFGLTDKADAYYETLSGGQKQRLALALAFVGDPPLLVLDEPGAGLDPQMRRELHDHIRGMKQDGRGVLLTTHDMEEASALCDRVAVMAGGRILATGTPGELMSQSRAATLEDAILHWTRS
ncbi:MAG TPA: ABC transporter ATP-binding protein [Rhizomicrobium sp.]